MPKVSTRNRSVADGDWYEIAAKIRVQVMDPNALTRAAIDEARNRSDKHEGGQSATEEQIAEIRSDLAEAIIELVDPVALTGNIPGAEPSDAEVSVGVCEPFQPSV
jgi:hypothetical protein